MSHGKCNTIVTAKMAAYKWLFVLSLISIQTASCSRLDMQKYQTEVMDRPSGQWPCVYGFFPFCKLDYQYCTNRSSICINYLHETEAVDSNIKRCLMEMETNKGVTVEEKGKQDVCYYFVGKNVKMLIQNSQQWCKPNEFYNFTTLQCELIFLQGQSAEEKRLKCETLNNSIAPKEILVACKDFLLELTSTLDKIRSQHKCLLKGRYFNETTGQCVPVFPMNASENEQLSFCESLKSDPNHMEVVSVCNKFLLEYVKKPIDQSCQVENWCIAAVVILIVQAVVFAAEKFWKNFCSNINWCNSKVPQNQCQEGYNQVPLEERPRTSDELDEDKNARWKTIGKFKKDNK